MNDTLSDPNLSLSPAAIYCNDKNKEVHVENSKPLLVLDLDETLIRASRCKGKNNSQKPITVHKHKFYIKYRPGLKEFLQEMKKYYDIYIFTASEKEYGTKILDLIAPFIPESHRFFEDSITHDDGVNVKDLTKISKSLNKILLVDNDASSGYYQPNNTIVINSWYGDLNDNSLLQELQPVLIEATCESNICIGASKAIETQHPRSIALVH